MKVEQDKKPQAGEWWQGDTTQLSKRAFVCGFDRDGCVIWQTSQNSGLKRTTLSVFLESHRHLPECDSFEWQPETFPQFYRGVGWSDYDAYVRFDSRDAIGVAFKADGTSSDCCQFKFDEVSENIVRFGWRKLTQAQAESRVKKPEPPASRNYVRLWTHRTSGTVCTATDEKYLKYPEIWTELKHDGTGFYLADQQR